MSLESFAFDNLKRRHPNLQKNGLKAVLRHIDKVIEPAEEMYDYSPGFIPDATIWDEKHKTVLLYEIEDTSKITYNKLSAIILFGHTLYDCAGCYTELWVVDRYGVEEKRVWRVKDEIMWTYEPTGEWLSEAEIEEREVLAKKKRRKVGSQSIR